MSISYYRAAKNKKKQSNRQFLPCFYLLLMLINYHKTSKAIKHKVFILLSVFISQYQVTKN